MANYSIGSYSTPGPDPRNPVIAFIADLPGGGTAQGDLGLVMEAIDIAAEKIQMNLDAETLRAWITALAALAEDYEATRLEMEEDRFVRASIAHVRFPDQGVVYEGEAEFLAACGLAAGPAIRATFTPTIGG